MKKRLSLLFVVVAIMSMFASTVLAVPAAGKSIELVSVTYERSGMILTFKTSGLTKNDLKNVSFEALSDTKGISCDLLDDGTTVRCSVDKSLAGQGGFKVVIAGLIFWGELPQAKSFSLICPDGQELWYNFQQYDNGVLSGSGTVAAWVWEIWEELYFPNDATEGITYLVTGQFCDELGPTGSY